MPTARDGLGAAGANGYLYGIGGSGAGVRATVERYDPRGDTWDHRAPLLTPRVLFAVGAFRGVLYAIGGSSMTDPFLDTNEAYQP